MAQVESFLQDEEMPPKTNLIGHSIPEDNYFIQTNEESKFLGTLIWKVLDFISFGQLESKEQENANQTQKVEQKKNDTSKEIKQQEKK